MPWRGTCTCGSLIWSWPPWPEVCHHNIVFLIADMGSKLYFKCLGNSHGFLLNFERRLSEKFQPVHMLPKVKNVILCCYFKAYLSFYQSSGCIIYKWKSAVGPLHFVSGRKKPELSHDSLVVPHSPAAAANLQPTCFFSQKFRKRNRRRFSDRRPQSSPSRAKKKKATANTGETPIHMGITTV